MNVLSKAYIAGFFDGEGSVNIIHQKARGEDQKHKDTHFITTSLANTNRQVLEKVQEIYGGNIAESKPNGNRKVGYRLHLTRRKAELFLKDISPFLLLKRSQVLIGLKSRETIRKGNYCGRSEVLSENEIKRLNQSHIDKLICDIPEESKIEYLAGFFDGEGSVSILKPLPKVHRLFVSISSVDKGIIEWIKFNAEDIGWITKRTHDNENWSDSWKWQVSDEKAFDFLKLIQPYIIIKQKQIEVAEEFRKTILPSQGLHFGSKRGSGNVKNPVTEELEFYRDELQTQMNILNKRGI
jgi:hypothetical protein